MKKIALFPGSFDPFTKGHEDVIKKALKLFDEIIIGIGVNSNKASYYSLDSRKMHIESLYKNEPKISVQSYQKLTTEFCKDIHATFILRGLRDVKDFEYERSIAQLNHHLNTEIETVFLITDPQFNHLNSSIIREISKNGGIIADFVTNSHILVS
ncbi:MAG: pantetheine-phosphate adenylyltransferase [Bacteroidota bacterium]